MSRLQPVFFGLLAGWVFAPQVAGAQVSISCAIRVEVCVSTVNGQDCHTDIVQVACPGSGGTHLSFKMAMAPESVARRGAVKEGSVCVVTRRGGHDASVRGKIRNGVCELDHPFP